MFGAKIMVRALWKHNCCTAFMSMPIYGWAVRYMDWHDSQMGCNRTDAGRDRLDIVQPKSHPCKAFAYWNRFRDSGGRTMSVGEVKTLEPLSR